MGRTEGPDGTPSRPSNRDKRGGGGGPRPSQSRTVLISKAMSRLLRHQAENEKVPITSDGWVRLDHLLAWKGLSSRIGGPSEQPSVEEIWHVVEENEKKRFAVRWVKTDTETGTGTTDTTIADSQSATDTTTTEPEEAVAESETNRAIQTWRAGTDTTPSHYFVRASQGHSIKTITSTNELMRPITLDDPTSIPTTCVHGTFYGSWQHILKSGGLKAMGRNHVHFATGPALADILPNADIDEHDDGKTERVKVISGMRHDAQILIYVDLKRCLEDVKSRGAEMEWWRSENDVLLTAGVDAAAVSEDDGVAGESDINRQTENANVVESKSSLQSQEKVDEDKTDGGEQRQSQDNDTNSMKSGNWKQKMALRDQRAENDKLVPMKYWTVVVEVKKGLGVLWRQGEGVVKELPADLAEKGTPKGHRGRGGRGRGGAGRGDRGRGR